MTESNEAEVIWTAEDEARLDEALARRAARRAAAPHTEQAVATSLERDRDSINPWTGRQHEPEPAAGPQPAEPAAAPQAQPAPASASEVWLLNREPDGRQDANPAVVDGPGPHGFMDPSAPKRFAVRYVLARSPEPAPISEVRPGMHGWHEGGEYKWCAPVPELNARALAIAQECLPEILGVEYPLALSRLHTAIVRGMRVVVQRSSKP